MRPRDFIRRVGFGLRPDDQLPSDPLAWANSQFDSVPELIWPGRIYSEAKMLDIRIDFVDAEDAIDNEIKNQPKRKKSAARYHRTGRRFFESYELAIRHHPADMVMRPFSSASGISGATILPSSTRTSWRFCTGPMRAM